MQLYRIWYNVLTFALKYVILYSEQRKVIKMKFRNKAQFYGFKFGEICESVGVLSFIMCILYFSGKADIIITKTELLVFVTSVLLIHYGVWRTRE